MEEIKLTKEYKNVWELINEEEKNNILNFAEYYKDFISSAKTERLSVKESLKIAKEKGFTEFKTDQKLKPGDRIYFINKNKNIILYIIGKNDIEKGIKILAAHIDSPRIDLKPNPMYEDGNLCLFDTHYYGGIKKYQWTTIPLALYGVMLNKENKIIEIGIGDDQNDPVFYISDLLIHLAKDQMNKTLAEGVSAEKLNIIIGSIPLIKNTENNNEKDKQKNNLSIKENILKILNEKYEISEEDFVGAEIEAVPAGKARDVGFDRSLILGYGHDDRSCSYAALRAITDINQVPEKTLCVALVDKEEIGSYGNTGLESNFFEYTLLEVFNSLKGEVNILSFKRMLNSSLGISADVTAGFDPTYAEVHDKKNTYFINKGVGIKKYTGSRGKSGASDANAEFISKLRNFLSSKNIIWQSGELGKVDQGGGGTVAFLLARYNMEIIDMGVPVLSMHSPLEVISKADLYMTYKAYKAFLEDFNI
ncbi:MAG TPA: aminopeptidase [Spirochaetota bacterium]|nr:aminopeptidase [Spirochaetota bacterium]HOM38580.1 aminopeptidase [Spirochaetota bacterium]HPQ49717.1 aminopeptidase [Spirochaetota bacterium]